MYGLPKANNLLHSTVSRRMLQIALLMLFLLTLSMAPSLRWARRASPTCWLLSMLRSWRAKGMNGEIDVEDNVWI
jgi:hypothetical protein